jgi:hypothetical protein
MLSVLWLHSSTSSLGRVSSSSLARVSSFSWTHQGIVFHVKHLSELVTTYYSRAHQGIVFDVQHFDVLALLALIVCFTYTRFLVFSWTDVGVVRGLMMCVPLMSPCAYG